MSKYVYYSSGIAADVDWAGIGKLAILLFFVLYEYFMFFFFNLLAQMLYRPKEKQKHAV